MWLTLRSCRPTATVAANESYASYSTVCGAHEMMAGVHCAHFEWRTLGNYTDVGVVGPGFDPAAGGQAAIPSTQGWMLNMLLGGLMHGGSFEGSDWAGQPKRKEIKGGDVVVRRPPCAAPRRGCAEGLACACRAWCSTSTPAGETHRPRQLRRIPLPISS